MAASTVKEVGEQPMTDRVLPPVAVVSAAGNRALPPSGAEICIAAARRVHTVALTWRDFFPRKEGGGVVEEEKRAFAVFGSQACRCARTPLPLEGDIKRA